MSLSNILLIPGLGGGATPSPETQRVTQSSKQRVTEGSDKRVIESGTLSYADSSMYSADTTFFTADAAP
jgi:hypothetical protein